MIKYDFEKLVNEASQEFESCDRSIFESMALRDVNAAMQKYGYSGDPAKLNLEQQDNIMQYASILLLNSMSEHCITLSNALIDQALIKKQERSQDHQQMIIDSESIRINDEFNKQIIALTAQINLTAEILNRNAAMDYDLAESARRIDEIDEDRRHREVLAAIRSSDPVTRAFDFSNAHPFISGMLGARRTLLLSSILGDK